MHVLVARFSARVRPNWGIRVARNCRALLRLRGHSHVPVRVVGNYPLGGWRHIRIFVQILFPCEQRAVHFWGFHMEVCEDFLDRIIALRVREEDCVVVAIAPVHAFCVGPSSASLLVLLDRLPVSLSDFHRADCAGGFLPS